MLSIANNVSALVAQNNVARTNSALRTSLERLSSGFKINRGADGPAALTISEKQRTQIAGLRQAIDNSEKAASVVQIAEGALNEINSLLVRVRSLAIDSANSGFNDPESLAANQAEIDNALDTINRISNNTQFGTKKLLDGSAGVKGTPTDSDVTFLQATTDTTAGNHNITDVTAGTRGFTTAASSQTGALAADETLTINGVTVELFAGMSQTQVRDRINDFNSQTGATAEINASVMRIYSDAFGSAADVSIQSNIAAGNLTSGFGTTERAGTGTDIIVEIGGTAAFNGQGNTVTIDSGAARGLSLSFAVNGSDATETVSGAQGAVVVADNSLVFQIGPNKDQTANVAISKMHSASLGIGVNGNLFSNLSEIDVTSASKAQDAIEVIDAAVDDVTNLRGTLGAFQQNTLESTANNLRSTLENSVNAESVIRDTDFASEIANFTKQQVLMQAGTSVLGSANQLPQLILSLLG